jgi:ABC-type Mn2+/Zn2+ transport system permease subunit
MCIFVVVAMLIIGVLVVSAIIGLSAALAVLMVKRFRQALIVAISVRVIGMWGGLTTLYYDEVPSGATIAWIGRVRLLIRLRGRRDIITGWSLLEDVLPATCIRWRCIS